MRNVALIGYGEVGQIFARDLDAAGVNTSAFDILFDPRRPVCRPPARAAADPASAVSTADLVISAVTANSAVAAAASVAPAIRPGTILLDINSVSPATKRAAFDVVQAAGGRYVEAAVMAAVPPLGIGVPMLLGGPYARDAARDLAALGFNVTHHSDEIGVASAVKMCRSVVVKGLEALLAEALASARRHGAERDVLDSLAGTFPGEDWNRLAAYMIGRAMEHGKRRGEEMREVARTVEEAGLSPDLCLAVADRQDWTYAKGRGARPEGDLATMLDALTRDMAKAEQ